MTTPGAAPSSLVLLLESPEDGHQEQVQKTVAEMSLLTSVTRGDGWSAVRVGDGVKALDVDRLTAIPGVERAVHVKAPYQLASREIFDTDREIRLATAAGNTQDAGTRTIGSTSPLLIIAGPQRDELDPSIFRPTPEELVAAGASVIHAGEFSDWPLSIHRRSAESSHAAGLLFCLGVSEAEDLRDAETVADLVYVGPKHMQDFDLLRKLGAIERPVLLARSFGATVEEFLLAAEYILAHGNGRVIFCESGIKTPSSPGRPRFEINAIPLLKSATHLPVVADPTETLRDARLVGPVSSAAVAAGCDGLMLKVGDNPVSGALQAPVTVPQCHMVVEAAGLVARSVGRKYRQLPTRPSTRSATLTSRPVRDATVDTTVDPQEVLRITDSTLGSVIERAFGTRPRLDVVSQSRVEPPHASWLTWALRPEGDLLVRWTGYRIGRTVLSRNVAYVDVSRVDPKIVVRLQSGQMNLVQLFSSTEIDKFGFEFGTSADVGVFGDALAEGHTDLDQLGPYVWRRYIAASAGRAGFIVVEALPTFAWRGRHFAEDDGQFDTQGGVA